MRYFSSRAFLFNCLKYCFWNIERVLLKYKIKWKSVVALHSLVASVSVGTTHAKRSCTCMQCIQKRNEILVTQFEQLQVLFNISAFCHRYYLWQCEKCARLTNNKLFTHLNGTQHIIPICKLNSKNSILGLINNTFITE